jgi:hypothetical protein
LTAANTGTLIDVARGPNPGLICINALGGIEFGTGAVLGATSVSAVADYPYTRGEHPKIGSAPLTKLFTSAFAKTVTVSPAVAGPLSTSAYTVTITAVDICGNPIVAEPIQVYALSPTIGAAVLAPVAVGSATSVTSSSAVVTVLPSTGTATLSLEVLPQATCLVIKVVFPLERIERFAPVLPCPTTQGTVTVPFAPGWNMVGGPAGSSFAVAEAMFAYNASSGQYTNASSSAGNISSGAPGCTGYWAYFAAPMVVSLPATTTSGATASCTLAAGWNLVGNPFSTPARLPAGTTAYHWNGTSYDVVGTIPVGGSVWIYNGGGSPSVTLTAT